MKEEKDEPERWGFGRDGRDELAVGIGIGFQARATGEVTSLTHVSVMLNRSVDKCSPLVGSAHSSTSTWRFPAIILLFSFPLRPKIRYRLGQIQSSKRFRAFANANAIVF